MRKFIKGLSLLLSVVMLTGCGTSMTPPAGQDDDQFMSDISVGDEEKDELPSVKDEPETRGDHPSVYNETETDTTEVPEDIKIPLNAQYIRTGELVGYEGELKQPFRVVRSADELNAYYDEFKDVYYLGRQEKVYADTTIGFLDACDRFDEAFWQKYDLVLAMRTEGSGSIRHEVLTMTKGEYWNDTDWVINVRPLIPEACTCDMATWIFLIEVPKGILEADDVIRVDYIRDANQLGTSTTYVRTDGWKPENGDKNWYLDEAPRYFMDTKAEFEAYLEAHPELSDGFFAFCERYDDEFWQKKDLLLIVQREESGSIRHSVGKIFRNRILSDETWFVSVERRIPEEQTEDEAIWHFFIEIQDGKLDAEDVIAIHDKDVQVENKVVIGMEFVCSQNDAASVKDPKIYLISSPEQLDNYFEENKQKYNFTEKYTARRIEEVKAGYNPVFWEQNDIVLIALEGDVGQSWHEVTAVEWLAELNGMCKVTIDRHGYVTKPHPPSYRHILLPVPKGSVTAPGQVILNFVDVD